MASAVCRTAHLYQQHRLKSQGADRCGQPAGLWLRVAFGAHRRPTADEAAGLNAVPGS
jgi:hypothetical protein